MDSPEAGDFPARPTFPIFSSSPCGHHQAGLRAPRNVMGPRNVMLA